MAPVIEQLRNGLIISCQAEEDDPFNRPEHLLLFARAAELGGAAAVRACGTENVALIAQTVSLPVIGLTKSAYPDGSALITPDKDAVMALAAAGADIIAMDATDRLRPHGASSLELLRWATTHLNVPIMADVSTLEEGLQAAYAGAALVSTTLSGYAPQSKPADDPFLPDYALVHELSTRLPETPVVAEGRIMSPRMAQRAISAGAFAVVVGTALTRPRVMVQYFKEAIQSPGIPASY